MNTWERVNCTSLAGIVAALLLFAGSAIPEPSSAPAAQQAASESVSVDSESEPSGVAGLTVGELLRDAWATYQAATPEPSAPSGPYTVVPEYFAAYEGSVPEFTPGYFAIESKQFPGIFHAFHMVAAQRA